MDKVKAYMLSIFTSVVIVLGAMGLPPNKAGEVLSAMGLEYD